MIARHATFGSVFVDSGAPTLPLHGPAQMIGNMDALPQAMRITGGPTPWDYLVGICTIAATVIGLVAIVLALSAKEDVRRDRRARFDLDVLLKLNDALTVGRYDVKLVLALADILGRSALPETRKFLSNDGMPRDDGSQEVVIAQTNWKTEQRNRSLDEIRDAVERLTR